MPSGTFASITSCSLQPLYADRTCGHYKAEFFLQHFPDAPLMRHCNIFSSQCPKIAPSGLPGKSTKPTVLSVMLRHHCEGTSTANHLLLHGQLAQHHTWFCKEFTSCCIWNPHPILNKQDKLWDSNSHTGEGLTCTKLPLRAGRGVGCSLLTLSCTGSNRPHPWVFYVLHLLQ